jgi:hypothetical protein
VNAAAQSAAGKSGTGGLGNAQPLGWLVRAGFIARGLTYGLIAAITVRLAIGGTSPAAEPNQQGALTLIAQAPLGRLAMVAIAAGLLAYALWKLALAVLGNGPEGGGGTKLKDRLANLGGGLVYLAFASVAVRVLIGSAGNQTSEQRHAAAGVLGWPGGRWLVGLGGGCLIAISAYQVYAALSDDFAMDNKVAEMDERPRRVFLLLGRTGLTARALMFALVGYFLVRTATDFKPSSGLGLDGTLATVHKLPLGGWLLGFVAAGMLVFAVFSLFEARYQRL